MARDRQGWLKDTLRVSAMPALQLGPDPVASTFLLIGNMRNVNCSRREMVVEASTRQAKLLQKKPWSKIWKLHLDCGSRRFEKWVNVDVIRSDLNLDLSQGKLPWKDDCYNTIVSQHVIEHLELYSELIPLFRELHRVLMPGGKMWLSCPDMEAVCAGYQSDKGTKLLASVQRRYPNFKLAESAPSQQIVNYNVAQRICSCWLQD